MKFLLYILLNIYAIFSSNSLHLPTKNYPTKVFVRLELKHMTPILNIINIQPQNFRKQIQQLKNVCILLSKNTKHNIL